MHHHYLPSTLDLPLLHVQYHPLVADGLQGLISSDVFTLVKENREIDGPARGKASKSTQKATVILHQAKLVL